MPSTLKFISLGIFFFCFRFHSFSQIPFTSSNLPLVIITTGGQGIVDEPKIYATMGIVWNGPGRLNAPGDLKNNYNGNIAIEIRGSSSQMFPKKSYGFETKTSALADVEVSLLGMPEESDWILYAPYTDKTMIRDVLTYTLHASMGHWAPRCRYVELFVNGRYDGVYVLMEKIKRNNKRVNIAKLTNLDNAGENLTGGYIIKIDKTTGSDKEGWNSVYYNTVGRTLYLYDYPKAAEITSAQKSYIQSYIRMMENALYQENFNFPGNYHEYLNDSSFIDFMIINELAKNVDGYRLSSYLYKGKNDKINCGPVWDFNLAYGNADYHSGWQTSGFQYQAYLGNDGWQNPFWWNKLMNDPGYVQKLKRRWSSLRKNKLSDQRISFVTDSLTDLIADAKDRNYQRWTAVIGYDVWPNYFVGNSYFEEVNWMKNWLSNRLNWLDQQWPYDFTSDPERMAFSPVAVFPNPFTDRLTLQFSPGFEGYGTAELVTAVGKLVRKEEITMGAGQVQLDFQGQNGLQPGIYMLRIRKDNQILLTRKIVKQP